MIVPPSDSPPRNSSNLLRSERRWPSARSKVMALGLEFGDIAQPAQGPDRHRRPVQPLAEPRDVEFDRVRARFVVEAEELLGEIVLAQHPAEAASATLQQPRFPVWKCSGLPPPGDHTLRPRQHP